jgi:hypothetical protein
LNGYRVEEGSLFVWTGTWNVANAHPPTSVLEWLQWVRQANRHRLCNRLTRYIDTDRKARKTERETDRQTGRQAGRQAGRRARAHTQAQMYGRGRKRDARMKRNPQPAVAVS